jgi:hypothetical protein
MCMTATAKRRRRQFANGFRHIAKLGHPIYPSVATRSVHDAIARERAAAARFAKANTKSKRK